MSKTASTVITPTKAIKQYDGRDVLQQQIKVTNTGDGLSEAMTVEPQEFHIGDLVYVVMETTVAKVGYENIKDTDVLKEVPSLKAGTATIVDASIVAEVIAAQAKKINEAKGLLELDLDGDGGDE